MKYKIGDQVNIRTRDGLLKPHVIVELRPEAYFVKPVGKEQMPISYRYRENEIHDCDQRRQQHE
jgi:hypothetical protein